MNDTMGERVQAHRVAAQCAPVRQFILQNSGHHVYCGETTSCAVFSLSFSACLAVLASEMGAAAAVTPYARAHV
jgi:hypothetical protein